MRFTQKIKPGLEMESCSDEVLRQVEKIIKYGKIYGIPLKKGKRYRSAFTTEQINYLEKEFSTSPYIEGTRRKELSNFLDIPERAVKIWFQNRRMKHKKDHMLSKEDDKTTELSDVCDSLTSVKSSDSSSLPLLTTSTSLSSAKTKVSTVKETKHGPKKKFEYPPTTSSDISIVGSSNSIVTTTTDEVLPMDLLETSNTNRDVLFSDLLSSNIHQVTYSTPLNKIQNPGNHQNLENVNYASPPSAKPQDLSTKSFAQLQKSNAQENINDAKHSAAEIPFYMKGYYTPPYLPQGNVIWKPVNMAPMMTSASVPNLTFSNPESTMPNLNDTFKRDCNCNCHKPYVAPILLQNNSSPNLQYVIATVPFPYSSPKV